MGGGLDSIEWNLDGCWFVGFKIQEEDKWEKPPSPADCRRTNFLHRIFSFVC